MYTPSHYAETRLEVLHALMRAHPLAALITSGRDGPVANHVPIELEPNEGPIGTLRGHVARANPIWREHDHERAVLVIFQGPQAYVSPSWYPSKRTDGRVVPTWNYAVVHAYGRAKTIEDDAWLHALVNRLTNTHESDRTEPWHVADAPDDYIAKMLRGIVGFEIPIDRIEGKWKMSQNHTVATREGTVAGLRAAGGSSAAAVADLVAGTAGINRSVR